MIESEEGPPQNDKQDAPSTTFTVDVQISTSETHMHYGRAEPGNLADHRLMLHPADTTRLTSRLGTSRSTTTALREKRTEQSSAYEARASVI